MISDSLGLNGILNLCVLLNCSTVEGLGDPKGQLFMIEIPSALAPLTSLLDLNLLGLVSVAICVSNAVSLFDLAKDEWDLFKVTYNHVLSLLN